MSEEGIQAGIPDGLIPVTKLPDILPKKNGKKIHVGTCWRYVLNGRRGVKMRSVLVAGVRYTKPEWAWDFFTSTSDAGPCPVAPASRTPSRRNRAVARAAAELAASGI